jgi:hypothetical protein
VGSVASGRSCRATAALFGVSAASVVKWCQRWRATGSAAASRMGGWRPLLLQSERDWLLARIIMLRGRRPARCCGKFGTMGGMFPAPFRAERREVGAYA